jgi:hypothetical protein
MFILTHKLNSQAKAFNRVCPLAHSYAYQDRTGTFAWLGEGHVAVFWPKRRGQRPVGCLRACIAYTRRRMTKRAGEMVVRGVAG